MSYVCNVAVFADLGEDDARQDINRFLTSSRGYEGDRLTNVANHAGGGKAFQGAIYAGAFNGLDVDAFLRAVEIAPWRDRGFVMVVLQDEDDEQPRAYTFVDGVLGLCPTPFPPTRRPFKRTDGAAS